MSTSSHRRRGLLAVVPGIVLAGMLTACGSAVSDAGGADVTIGTLHPLSGPASYYGIPMDKGAELAVEQINASKDFQVDGKPLKITLESGDSKADPAAATTALQRQLSQGVKYIIGPLASGESDAVVQAAATRDVTLVIDGANAKGLQKAPNIFRVQSEVGYWNEGLAALVAQEEVGSVAVLTDKFHTGFYGSRDQLTDLLEDAGVEIESQASWQAGDTDFRSQLTPILVSQKPEALIMRGFAVEQALATRQARELGFKGKIFWEALAPAATVEKNISNDLMENVYNSYPPTAVDLVAEGRETAVAFADAYEEKFDEAPGELSALSYDAIYILARAMVEAGTSDRKAVETELAALPADDNQLVNPFIPASGDALFDSEGQARLDSIGVKWDMAKKNWVVVQGTD